MSEKIIHKWVLDKKVKKGYEENRKEKTTFNVIKLRSGQENEKGQEEQRPRQHL